MSVKESFLDGGKVNARKSCWEVVGKLSVLQSTMLDFVTSAEVEKMLEGLLRSIVAQAIKPIELKSSLGLLQRRDVSFQRRDLTLCIYGMVDVHPSK